jgi:hypothetical protein
MKQGTVYLYKDFRFHDGEKANKYFIILNNPLKDEPFLTCKTTSRQKWRPDREGCHDNLNLFVLRENYDFFSEKTWVQFHIYYPISQDKLLRLKEKGIISKRAELKDQTVRAIINCISKSEDICGLYLTMIKR